MTGLEGQLTGKVGAFALDARFSIAGHGVTALIGPSGSGKTTVLRCIAGLTRLTGRLTVDGEIWQDDRRFLPAHRRPVGVVFQDAGLLQHLSVRDNLLYGQKRAGPAQAIALDEAVDLLGLKALLSRATAHLSGGERQRVAIGRALLSQPRLLLMDEPVSNLDGDSKAEILTYLERLHRALALPVLYVSHDLAEVRRLADTVLVMRDGKVEQASPDWAADGRTAAEARLAAMDGDEIRRLALAALIAGLKT